MPWKVPLVFIAGAVVQWLRDELRIIRSSADVEKPPNRSPIPMVFYVVHRPLPDWVPCTGMDMPAVPYLG